MRLTEEQLLRIRKDPGYWATVAGIIIAEAQAKTGSRGSGSGPSLRPPAGTDSSSPIRVKVSDSRERILRVNIRLQKERTLRQLKRAVLPVETGQEEILESLDPKDLRKLLLPKNRFKMGEWRWR